MITPAVLTAAAACLLGCYFAACHAALKSFSRKRLVDRLDAADKPGEKIVERLLERRRRLMLLTAILRAAMTLVVTLAVYYAVSLQVAGRLHTLLTLLLAFLIAGVLVALFCVAIPISWARYRRERLLSWSTPVLYLLARVFAPLTRLFLVVDPVIRRISGHDLEKTEDDLSDNVRDAIETHEQHDAIDEDQKQMLQAVFDLPKTSAGEVMTPRTEVQGIEIETPLDEVKQYIIDVGHSRIPVYTESIDQIDGILYAKDLIAYVGDGEHFDIRSLLREPRFVPESKSLVQLLADFRETKVHMAIVLDEYGGTAGLVTIEDVLEEIVGEIQDEYEPESDEPAITPEGYGIASVDARVDIDDLADHLGFDVPTDADYDTVGGFVFSQLGHIPDPGEHFEFESFRFTVTDAERTKVLQVRAERIIDEHASAEAR
ncbi:MAG: hemolysin family protein [Planctomycetota bacterium]